MLTIRFSGIFRGVSSINPHFTLNYVQPEEYQFSHDSVFLARRIFEIVQQTSLVYEKTMDLCSGCGVVGIDFLMHLQNAEMVPPQKIDFLEIQSVYHKFFAQNIAQVSGVNAFEFITLNYADVCSKKELGSKYDLILSNPPYFEKDLGVLSDSDFKNRCRFFIDSDFENLMKALIYLLKPTGSAFVLLKDLENNGRPLKDQLRRFSDQLKFAAIEKIRTTDLYQIQLV